MANKKRKRKPFDEDIIDPEVKEVFEEEQRRFTGKSELQARIEQHTATSPILSGGDVDADWEDANESGEEAVGGMNPTPDQSVVDELGQAVGLTYQDREPLHTDDKIAKRQRDRWELNPASAEDFQERRQEEHRESKRKKVKQQVKPRNASHSNRRAAR